MKLPGFFFCIGEIRLGDNIVFKPGTKFWVEDAPDNVLHPYQYCILFDANRKSIWTTGTYESYTFAKDVFGEYFEVSHEEFNNKLDDLLKD